MGSGNGSGGSNSEFRERYRQLKGERHHEGRKPGFIKSLFMGDLERKVHETTHWKTRRGEPVQSFGEMLIADYLYTRGIGYEYSKLIWIGKHRARPDFDLPGWTYHLFIEFWGLCNRPEYKEKIPRRRKVLQQYPGYNLIDVYPHHLPNIDHYLDREIAEKRSGLMHL